MNRPLAAGTSCLQGTVSQVLAWSQQSGVYRWEREHRVEILKVLYLPEIDASALAPRLQRLRQGLEAWQALQSPLQVKLLEIHEEAHQVILRLEDAPGKTLSQVDAAMQLDLPWSEFLPLAIGLARGLEKSGLDAFQVDHWVFQNGCLRLFNPGWSALLWESDPPCQGMDQVRSLGRWLTFLSQHLQDPPAWLTWLRSRCAHPDPRRCYPTLEAVEQGLVEASIENPKPRLRGKEALPDLDLSNLSAAPERRPLPLSWQLALVSMCLMAMTLAWVVRNQQLRRLQWRGPGLYLLGGSSLRKLSLEGKLLAQTRLPGEVSAMSGGAEGHLYLAPRDEAALWVFQRGELRRSSVADPPRRLLRQPAEGILLAQLGKGEVVRWALRAHRESDLKPLSLGGGQLLQAFAAGWVVMNQDRLELWHGTPPGCRASRRMKPPLAVASQGPLLLCLQDLPPGLVALDEELQVVQQRDLQTRAVDLLASPYERRCWTLSSRNITRWKLPELSEESEVRLNSAAVCSCADQQGGLWWIDQDGALWCWAGSFAPRRLGNPGPARALAYVSD